MSYIKNTRAKIGHDMLMLPGVFSGKDMLHTYPNGDQVSVVSIVYTCDDFSGEIIPETNETTELRWFDIHEIPDNINPCDKKPFAVFVSSFD